MADERRFWVIILAAGEGQRVRALTVDRDGKPVPKQYCLLDGTTSMLGWTVERAKKLVPAKRVVCVVAEQHRRWWQRDLSPLPMESVVVQPENRGTAPGILLPLLTVLRRDPLARVLVLPSDHYVEDEDTLCDAIQRAMQHVMGDDDRVMLLGMVPDDFHHDYGWIVPSDPPDQGTAHAVEQFVEKPDSRRARKLMRAGALMNSMILAGSGNALLELCEKTVPDLVDKFRAIPARRDADMLESVRGMYRILDPCDFSRAVLERAPNRLAVLPVPLCGWSDLGTPARLSIYCSRHHPHTVIPADGMPPGSWFG